MDPITEVKDPRITDKDEYYISLAFAVSKGSKCLRAAYGSVVVKDGRIVATGYNGKPPHSINDHICYREGLPDNASKPNCCIHSEANAIIHSAPEERQGATLYVSGVPCTDCALLIMASGIRRVVYYDGPAASGHLGNSDLEFWKKYGFDEKVELVPIKTK
ncbi:MAG TPA: deaminase [Anaerolineaceae bacterium]|jgi:dCMP deaminase